MDLTRRDFARIIAVAGAAPLSVRADQGALHTVAAAGPVSPVVMFSKHLPDLGWRDLGAAVREAGFDGVDLTVRPGGHVLPERVAEDLPRAVSAIRDAGSHVAMLTTGLTRPDDPTAQALLRTAAAVDVRRLKAGYYRYAFDDVPRELEKATVDFRALVQMAGDAGVQLAYHNHSGSYVGAAVWDALRLIDGLPAAATGIYFDPRHATVEGGDAGWRIAIQMAAPHLRMVAIKDFYWERGRDGRARVVDCPVGEGVVDWKGVATELRRARFSGPISLHVEYEPGGRTPVEKRERMLEAAVKDRRRLVELLSAAAETPAPR